MPVRGTWSGHCCLTIGWCTEDPGYLTMIPERTDFRPCTDRRLDSGRVAGSVPAVQTSEIVCRARSIIFLNIALRALEDAD